MIKHVALITEDVLRFHWEFYSELAFQRRQIETDLCGALEHAVERNFSFKAWQRVVKYRYSLHPLCGLGSRMDPGGRFNIGDIDPLRFPVFGAIYLAADKQTAMQEALGQDDHGSKLSPLDLALTSKESITQCAMSGTLSVVDIRAPEGLAPFVDLIKGFYLSPSVLRQAKQLKLSCSLATTPAQLQEVLLGPNWRLLPMSCDVPASSQLFGQLVLLGGFDGILYPSKFTGQDCLAVFPQSFVNSSGYIEIDDEPLVTGIPKRLDGKTWMQFEMSADQLRQDGIAQTVAKL